MNLIFYVYRWVSFVFNIISCEQWISLFKIFFLSLIGELLMRFFVMNLLLLILKVSNSCSN